MKSVFVAIVLVLTTIAQGRTAQATCVESCEFVATIGCAVGPAGCSVFFEGNDLTWCERVINVACTANDLLSGCEYLCESDASAAGSVAAPQRTVEPALPSGAIYSYRARISAQDRLNSEGEALSNASSIVRQERAWFHRFGRRDFEDETDTLFTTRAGRDWLSDHLSFAPGCEAQVATGTPLIRVTVYATYAHVTCLDG